MNRPMTTTGFSTEVVPVPGRPDVEGLVVTGRVTYLNAPQLRNVILDKISNTKANTLVVELSHVQHMDTSGVAVLVEALLASRARDLPMFLCQPSESVLQIFRLAGLHDALAACCANPAEVMERLQ